MIAEVPFSELLSVVIDNRGKTCPTADAGIPLIATNCIRNELLYPTYDKVRFVSKETYSNWFRGHPLPGDIIFVNKATPGRVCLVPDPVDFCIAQDMVAVRANPKRVYPNYLFAVLRSPAVQEKIGQMHVGTLIPHFKKGDFDKLLLPIPEPEAQEFIGDTYFELSAKIDANRRMNATLEAMARALFQSWFVDFDPVRAKLDGRPPAGLDEPTAALFPAQFQASEVGEIPQGWSVSTVGEISEVVCGKTPPTAVAAYYGDDIPFVTIPDMHGKVFSTSTARKLSVAGANSQPKKTLSSGSICVSCIATPGLVVITSEKSQTNQQINSITPDRTETYFWYWVMKGLGAQISARGSGGSVLSNLNKSGFEAMKILKPPVTIVRTYHSITAPLFQTILANARESRTLATLRDTLLPKLLSGSILSQTD